MLILVRRWQAGAWRKVFRSQVMFSRLKQAVPAIVLALSLGGCIQPMYGGLTGTNLRSDLAAIKVEPIPERIGYYLANDLEFAFNGSGSEVSPKYRLVITVTEKVQTPLVDTISGRATAATVVVDANYKLMASGSDQPITEGTAFVASSYDRTSQRFANLRAARDAEIRAAKALSEQIYTRVASFMSGRS